MFRYYTNIVLCHSCDLGMRDLCICSFVVIPSFLPGVVLSELVFSNYDNLVIYFLACLSFFFISLQQYCCPNLVNMHYSSFLWKTVLMDLIGDNGQWTAIMELYQIIKSELLCWPHTLRCQDVFYIMKWYTENIQAWNIASNDRVRVFIAVYFPQFQCALWN